MRVVSVVGARPQFVKIAPVSRAMSAASSAEGVPIEDIIVHTGQHYDPGLSQIFFRDLSIPQPEIELGIGSGSHASQTGKMLEAIETVLQERQPDVVVVYGDTNSTLAGALAASKLNIPIAHVEAGLRSFDRSMPEEVNRIVADHTSELLFAPTPTAFANLRNENLADRAELVGDVMLDAYRFNSKIAADRSTILQSLRLRGGRFAIATLHRAGNTDTARLRVLLDSLNFVAVKLLPIIFPIHPRTANQIALECPDWKPHARLSIIDPVGYLDMLRLLDAASAIITDSGGLQKEAYFAELPCVTLRNETEWPETVEGKGNVLVGDDRRLLLDAIENVIAGDGNSTARISPPDAHFGNGQAAQRIVAGLSSFLAS